MARSKFDPEFFAFGVDGDGRPIAYRPNDVLVNITKSQRSLADILNDVREIVAPDGLPEVAQAPKKSPQPDDIAREHRPINDSWSVLRVSESADPVAVVSALRSLDPPVVAQLNHVYFASSLGSDGQVNPNYVAPNYVAPNYVAPNYVAPNYVAPNYVAPNYVAPNYVASNYIAGHAGGCGCGGCPEAPSSEVVVPLTSARKAWGALPGPPPTKVAADLGIQIHVLDVRPQTKTPMTTSQINARSEGGSRSQVWTALQADIKIRGALLPHALYVRDSHGTTRYREMVDRYLVEPSSDGRGANVNLDGYLDPVTNHGEFIKGVIDRVVMAGNTSVVTSHSVVGTLGDVEDADLVKAMEHIRETYSHNRSVRIMNLSLSGYNEDDNPSVILTDEIENLQDKGWLIVASAGNNGSCRLAWPAALKGVVSVGAYGPCGAAPFSNYGPWVDACGPGVDIVSKFPGMPGREALVVAGDIDAGSFDKGFAIWSGTSFSAPFVAAKLAVNMSLQDRKDDAGVKRPISDFYEAALDDLIRNHEALKMPGYGTVVSLENIRVKVTRTPDV